MSDDKPTPGPGEDRPEREPIQPEAPEATAGEAAAPAPARPTPEELEAKKKAALEKAAARKAAAAAGGDDKPAPTPEELEAKRKAAAAKAEAERKKAEEEAAKPPWERKPEPPQHEDAGEDPEVTALREAFAGLVLAADRFAGDVTVTIPHARVAEVCRWLKESRGFTYLVDLTAIDWPEREEGRFDLVWYLHRFEDNRRLRLLAVVPEEVAVPSVIAIWRTAGFLEREVWDMFGVLFADHPNLERILTWEGFNGHPLRKDFPMEGVDTGAAIYPDVFPPGGGPVGDEGAGA